jgi:FMN phosphatase YigB (HAD superfamily)
VIRFECEAILFDLDGVLVDSTFSVRTGADRDGGRRECPESGGRI